MPEFSIIVPIYKVEKYLEICIDSIIGQSFCDFELILVDDGSPDTCGEICDRYSSSDTRVKVVHKENGGLSSARNAGLDIATGKYVIFIDSDDFWDDASALEHIHINLTETDAGIAFQELNGFFVSGNFILMCRTVQLLVARLQKFFVCSLCGKILPQIVNLLVQPL